jgi:hypothetical protein
MIPREIHECVISKVTQCHYIDRYVSVCITVCASPHVCISAHMRGCVHVDYQGASYSCEIHECVISKLTKCVCVCFTVCAFPCGMLGGHGAEKGLLKT